MSYTIRYGPVNTNSCKKKSGWFGIIGAVLILTVCLLAVSWYLPQQARQFREALLPWTRSEVLSAFSEFRRDVIEGEPFNDALTAFCRDIIHGTDRPQ